MSMPERSAGLCRCANAAPIQLALMGAKYVGRRPAKRLLILPACSLFDANSMSTRTLPELPPLFLSFLRKMLMSTRGMRYSLVYTATVD